MYEEYFGLTRKPFEITPDPAFLYASPQHKEALASLLYGVREGKGLLVLTGEVGTGKTLLIRCLLEMLGPETVTAYVFNPRMSVMEFFQAVAHEFDLKGDFFNKIAFLTRLNEFLLEVAGRGEKALLIVDEAQNLSLPILEEIRLLMNLETSEQKLLQVILAGQPEFHRIINFSCMRQFRQRISLRAHLSPLTEKQTKAYIDKRLEVAGLDGGGLFTKRAISLIHRYSRGIPRLINVICDNSLLTAYAMDERRVHSSIVKEVIEDLEGRKLEIATKNAWPRDERDLQKEWSEPRTLERPKRWRWPMAVAIAAMGGIGAWALFTSGWKNLLTFLEEVMRKM
jgi:general secretion pathway protein A